MSAMRGVSVVGRHSIVAILVWFTMAIAAAQEAPRNIWAQQYKDRSAAAMAEQFEQPSRAVFRYRVAIAGLMELKPGMTAAEIGAGSGFLSRVIAQQVSPGGRVIATELDDKMVAYMNQRAKAEGITNFTALKGDTASSGLEPASVDAIAMVNTYSFFDRPKEMLQSAVKALKPGGLLLIVDIPETGSGATRSGVEAEDVIAAATAAGLSPAGESAVVPGHYALRFRLK
jgi:cyclopropane fatty-acyl-phospholipid synthase-like methyltransferase